MVSPKISRRLDHIRGFSPEIAKQINPLYSAKRKKIIKVLRRITYGDIAHPKEAMYIAKTLKRLKCTERVYVRALFDVLDASADVRFNELLTSQYHTRGDILQNIRRSGATYVAGVEAALKELYLIFGGSKPEHNKDAEECNLELHRIITMQSDRIIEMETTIAQLRSKIGTYVS